MWGLAPVVLAILVYVGLQLWYWYDHGKVDRYKKAYKRGYDYAVGSLLRGEKTVQELEALASPVFKQSASATCFDNGVLDGIRHLQQHPYGEPTEDSYIKLGVFINGRNIMSGVYGLADPEANAETLEEIADNLREAIQSNAEEIEDNG